MNTFMGEDRILARGSQYSKKQANLPANLRLSNLRLILLTLKMQLFFYSIFPTFHNFVLIQQGADD
jgi:hypothetical protein